MAKETSNGSSFKNPFRFNEQVNTILLIMFLAVVVVLFLNGGRCFTAKQQKSTTIKKEQIVERADSIPSDSIVNLH